MEKNNDKRNNLIFGGLLGLVLILIITILILVYFEVQKPRSGGPYSDSTFSINFIRESNKANFNKKNYMVSPYSVEIALSMLRDGSGGTTFEEINKIAPKRGIKYLRMDKKVNVANGLFIKDSYKDYVISDYIQNLKDNYNATVKFDKFSEPTIMNNWVKKETYGMIDKLVDRLDKDFVLGIVNAVALDAEWENKFTCENTVKDDFHLADGTKMNVSMMNNSFKSSAAYYEDDNIKSVILPYKKYSETGEESEYGEQLEFIGILPNEDIDQYINNITLEDITNIDKNKKVADSDFEIKLSIPKFSFDYDFAEFKNTLIKMGIKEVFSSDADLSNMLEGDSYYINEAIHKSYIEFDEEGTKASAVTGFLTKDNAVIENNDLVEIKFDRPFVFLIKDVNGSEILFFGVVYSPSKYKKSSCVNRLGA